MIGINPNANQTAVAEIVAASEDGNLLVYADSVSEHLGFVDSTDPSRPVPAGVLPVGGEPTSVAVAGPHALAVVNTGPSFSAPSGQLHVVALASRTIVRTIALKDQPDSIAPFAHFRGSRHSLHGANDQYDGSRRSRDRPR